MFGIIIGVASVILIAAIGEGVKQQVGAQIHQYGPNIITVRTSQLSVGSGSSINNISSLSGLSISGPLSGGDISTISKVKNISSYAPLTLVSGQVSGDNGVAKDSFVVGTNPSLPGLLNESLSYGNFLAPEDAGTNEAVIGQDVATRLFNESVPLGRVFTFRNQTFIVKGIFNEFNTAPLSQQADFNNAVFIPYDVAEGLTNNTAPTYEVLARANKPSNTSSAASSIKAALNQSHGGDSGFSVLTGNQNLAVNNSILDLLTKLIAGVAGLSLLVAGVGIMNVMLVSVSDRLREIGIRKAVGATNRQILAQFMVESTFISTMGGILGILLAFFVDLCIRVSSNFRPDVSWQIVVLASGVSILVGIVFGSVPAVKAAKKDPIDALRAE
jgi:putative ABC transport system permease protein